MSKRKKYWIPRNMKKGALHRQLHIPADKKIPLKDLNKVAKTPIGRKVRIGRRSMTVTHLLKKRAVCARNLRRLHK